MDEDLPADPVRDRWDDVEADLEATAAELEADGWTCLTLHTADVTSLPGDESTGLDVLVPDNEFENLEERLADGAAYTETTVLRSTSSGVVFLVCVLKDPDGQHAVLFPVFYPREGEAALALAEQAREAGELNVFVHPLNRERVVTFTIARPELVFPAD